MDPALIKAMVKQMFASSSRAFINNLVQESAENFSVDQLSDLIGILQKVEKRKRGTVDTTASPPR
jgi:hypothetical protein